MGTACGKGSCAPSSPRANPHPGQQPPACQACQLRGTLCDLCAASSPPTPTIKTQEQPPGRTSHRSAWQSKAADFAPEASQDADWYDPTAFQRPPVQPRKLKALRDEFDEDDEVLGAAAPGLFPARCDEEFQYTVAHPNKVPESRSPQLSKHHEQKEEWLQLEETQDWVHDPVVLQPPPKGHNSEAPADASPPPESLETILPQLLTERESIEALGRALQNPWEPGAAVSALVALGSDGTSEFASNLSLISTDWRCLVESGLIAIVDAALMGVLQAVRGLALHSLHQLAASVEAELAHFPPITDGVHLALTAVQSQSTQCWLESANELCMVASSIIASGGVVMETEMEVRPLQSLILIL